MSGCRWVWNGPWVHPRGLGPPVGASALSPGPGGEARRRSARLPALGLVVVTAAIGLAIPVSLAQQSPNYTLKESVFNAGGHPADGAVLTSAGYRLRIDAVGETVVAPSLSSASYRVGGGFVSRYPPPGPVLGVAFADQVALRWDPEPSVGSYNVYRGLLAELPGGGYGSCLLRNLASETANDIATPSVGSGWFYLVTAQNRLDEEGTKGTNSAGVERPNPAPCP